MHTSIHTSTHSAAAATIMHRISIICDINKSFYWFKLRRVWAGKCLGVLNSKNYVRHLLFQWLPRSVNIVLNGSTPSTNHHYSYIAFHPLHAVEIVLYFVSGFLHCDCHCLCSKYKRNC